MTNLLFIRDPREMLPSLAQQLPEPTLRDTGLQEQVETLEYMIALNQEPIVIEARNLLRAPESTLREVCGYLAGPPV